MSRVIEIRMTETVLKALNFEISADTKKMVSPSNHVKAVTRVKTFFTKKQKQEVVGTRVPVTLRGLSTLALALGLLWLHGSSHAEAVRSGVNVAIPNGYVTVTVDDLQVKSAGGPVRWTRSWDGQEWKFNAHWETLSQSWKNLTGSQSADTTPGQTPAATTTLGSSGSGNSGTPITTATTTPQDGSGGGCWAKVDEDWEPHVGTTMVGGMLIADPMVKVRTTPFNRLMGESGSVSYSPPQMVNIDYASLCMGMMNVSGGGVRNTEAIRRINELYLGDEGRYAFDNRTILEKRSVSELPALSAAALYASLASGKITLIPGTNAKGYRWMTREGDWIDYNTQGQVVAYGDKNNNQTWLARDTGGNVLGVVDGNGQVIYSLHYTDELLTEIRDYPIAALGTDMPARSVKYKYDTNNRLVKVTDPRGYDTQYAYDAGNHLIKITDAEGREEKLSYINNSVKQRIAPDGGVTDYEFDYDDVNKQFSSKITGPETTAGRRKEDYTHNRVGKLVRSIVNGRIDNELRYDTGARATISTNARGFSTKIIKNEFDQIVEINYPDGSTQKRSYSALHLGITERIDQLGIKTQFQYDAKGNLTKKTEAAGTADERVTEYVKNTFGKTTEFVRKGRTESNGTVTLDAKWQIEYDSQGQKTKTTDPEGKVRQYVYDRDANLVQFTDPRHNKTRYEVDAKGNLTKATNALSYSRSYVYDKVDNEISYQDARQKTILSTYDGMNRNTVVTNPVNGLYQQQFNGQGLPVSETDEDGLKLLVEYDNFLELTKKIDGLGNTTQFGYQVADGSANGVLGSLNSATEINYPTFTQKTRFDQRERPTSLTRLNPSDTGVEGLTESISYDLRGRIKTTTDANGKTRYLNYDALDHLVKMTDSLGKSMYLTWDARDNLIEFKDFNGNVNKFEHDRNNRLIKETLPLGQLISYEYNENGQLVNVISLDQKQVNTYDAAGRRVKLELSKTGDASAKLSYLFAYDEEDNLTSWSDGVLSSNLSYNDAGWLIREQLSYGAGTSLAYEYTYTAAGRKKSIKYPDGTVVDYSYDKHGELGQVDIPGEGSISVNEWQWLAPKRTTLPGGTVRLQNYDGLLNLKNLTVKSPGQQTLLSLANRFDKTEEITERVITDSNGVASSTVTNTYTYDDEKRLTKVVRDTGGMFGTSTETFGLDAASNRTSHSAVSGTWTYDANDRLTQRGDTRYTYDDNGNLSQKTDGTSGAANTIKKFSYDLLNRLIEVRDGGNKLIAQYSYDPFDNRLSKTIYQDEQGALLATPLRSLYLYSEEGLIAEANAAADVTTQYGWKPSAAWSTAPLFIKTTIGNGASAKQGYAWLHNDHLGTPIRATDKAGAVVWRADLDSFGRATLGAENTLSNNLRFAGQYYDAETGLHYNTRRYYDPQVGRYISSDPLGLDGGTNSYAYVKGDPLNRTDSTGEFLPFIILGLEIGFEIYEAYQWANWIADTYDDIQNGTIGCSGLPPVLPKFPKFKPPRRKPCNSFTADTLVHVRPDSASDDDAQMGASILKPISALKLGDQVLAWSEWKAPEQAQSYERITDIISSNKAQQLVHLTLDDGKTITATDGHPFNTDAGWRDAILLKTGDKLHLSMANKVSNESKHATIKSVRIENTVVPVFNLEVANAHTFFVGVDGVLAHNGFGSYTIHYADGTRYHGKGDRSRANQSATEHSNGHWIKIDWTPSIDDFDSFRDEEKRIREDGGVDNKNNHNKRNSPGHKYPCKL